MKIDIDNRIISSDIKCLHEGHRQRVRDNIIKNGWDSLNEHQLLECLLFYCVPRQDTNELAHTLLQEFGNLAGVFDASVESLKTVKGVGERAAIYLTSFQSVFKAYKMSKLQDKPQITCVKDVFEYFGEGLSLLSKEEVYMLCLDSSSRVILNKKFGSGDSSQVAFSVKEVTETILRTNTSGVVLIHNHPSGSLQPSKQDIEITKQVYLNLLLNGVYLLDHLIISAEGFFSFKQNNIIEDFERDYNNYLSKNIFRNNRPKYLVD